MAALDNITPSLLSDSPLVLSIVNVVPSDVEQRAAPAANACKGVIVRSFMRMNERPMGTPIPVNATQIERKRFALSAGIEVDKPPDDD